MGRLWAKRRERNALASYPRWHHIQIRLKASRRASMNNTNIALRLSPEQRDRLQAAADMDKRPLAQMIRLLLDQALDARDRRIEAKRKMLQVAR